MQLVPEPQRYVGLGLRVYGKACRMMAFWPIFSCFGLSLPAAGFKMSIVFLKNKGFGVVSGSTF